MKELMMVRPEYVNTSDTRTNKVGSGETMRRRLLIFLLCVIAFVGVDVFYEVNYPKVNYVQFTSGKLDRGEQIRLLQIADYHNKAFPPGHSRQLLQRIKQLKPDLIVITGDLVDAKTEDYQPVYRLITQMVKINSQVYYVSGNHEWRSGRVAELTQGLQARGVTVLNNTHVCYQKGQLAVNLCGIDDPHSRHDDLERALAQTDARLYTILLSHAPDIVWRQRKLPVDLILCGHTHGGQIRLPFLGALIAPGQGFLPAYDKGEFALGKGTMLYIDSGYGTSVYPLRFWNRSQVSLITIRGE